MTQATATKAKKVSVASLAICAVALWSMKPVLIELLSSRLGFAESYLISSSIACFASLLIFVFYPSIRKRFVSNIKTLDRAIINSAISGLFLALWYYGFYRALMESESPINATVIAFSWPLIAVIAIRLLSKSKPEPLKMYQWALIILSFVGVLLISIDDMTKFGSSSNMEIIWACLAALGSGLYLPFSMNAISDIQSKTGLSEAKSTFLSVSISNIVSLISVLTCLAIFRQNLDFSHVDGQSVLICAIIGIGIYLVAEISWTWAMKSHNNLTLAPLPYLSPAISVMLLLVIFNEPIQTVTIIGLLTIMVSNLAIHISGKR